MNLETAILEHGARPRIRSRRLHPSTNWPRQYLCPKHGVWSDPGSWRCVSDRDDLDGDWEAECCWSIEHRNLDYLFSGFAAIGRAALRLDWSENRREAYLAAWPLHAQAEAQADALNGDTRKKEQMDADFAEIRARFPKPDEAPSSPWP